MIKKIINRTYIEYRNEFGELHREDGPAVECIFGNFIGRKEYWLNDKLHRLDGPAEISSDITKNVKTWFYHGKQIYYNTQEEFERIIKLAILF